MAVRSPSRMLRASMSSYCAATPARSPRCARPCRVNQSAQAMAASSAISAAMDRASSRSGQPSSRSPWTSLNRLAMHKCGHPQGSAARRAVKQAGEPVVSLAQPVGG